MQDENNVLALLRSTGGHLIHDVVAGTVNLYDSGLAAGNPRPSVMRVELSVLKQLLEQGRVVKTGGREQVRYETAEST